VRGPAAAGRRRMHTALRPEVEGIRECIRDAVRSQWFANGITRRRPICLDPVRNSKSTRRTKDCDKQRGVKLRTAKTTTEDQKAAAEAEAAQRLPVKPRLHLLDKIKPHHDIERRISHCLDPEGCTGRGRWIYGWGESCHTTPRK
jgi:hypothetical protein